MHRRSFLALAGAAPAMAATSRNMPVRKTGKVEVAFESAAAQPNGLQATNAGLWMIDQGPGSKAYLVSYLCGGQMHPYFS